MSHTTVHTFPQLDDTGVRIDPPHTYDTIPGRERTVEITTINTNGVTLQFDDPDAALAWLVRVQADLIDKMVKRSIKVGAA